MAWTVEYDPRVEKDLKAIDLAMQREILDYMDTRIAVDEADLRSVARGEVPVENLRSS